MRTLNPKWETIARNFEKSGLTQKEYCDENGISTSTLVNWLKRLRGTVSSPGQARFIQLDVGDISSRRTEHAPHESRESYDLVVELPLGVVMRFRVVTK